jgi:primosomal protein N' (replication factor Y) (superfamily II helicase)
LASIAKSKKQAVVFVNRRGFSTRTICENCKKILKCPKCRKALVYSEESGQYRCLDCAHKMDLLSACPMCGGVQFSHRGIGTQTVEKKIKNLFPAARIARIDPDTAGSSVKYKSILEKFSKGEIDILVGTQSAIKGISSKNIGLATAVSGRDFSDGAESSSREVALSRIFHMSNLLSKDGIILIQSFFGGNPLFDIFSGQDLKRFYRQELEMRKKFSYPPFRKFVKLTYSDKSEKKACSVAKNIFDLLQRAGNNRIEVTGPYPPLSKQKRGLYQRNILIRIDPKKNIRDLPIRSVLGALRKGWRVDVDPLGLF